MCSNESQDEARQKSPQETAYFMMEHLNIQQIDEVAMSRAQSVVESVNDLVYNKLKDTFPQFQMRSIEPLVLQGSVADGTKVSAPDEFDYMIPMDLCAHCWSVVKTSLEIGEFYQIERRYNHHDLKLCRNCHASRNYHSLLTVGKYCIMSERSTKGGFGQRTTIERFRDECLKSTARAGSRNLFYTGTYKATVRRAVTTVNLSSSSFLLDNRPKLVYSKQAKCFKSRRFNIPLYRHCATLAPAAGILYSPDDVCEKCLCLKRRISACRVFDGCSSSLKELENSVGLIRTPDDLKIAKAFASMLGPAITITVEYKSANNREAFDSRLSIDYVPAVCIDGRYFVAKEWFKYFPNKYPIPGNQHKYWRESFSHCELRLMREIKEHDSLLFEMYRSFKALLADLNPNHDEWWLGDDCESVTLQDIKERNLCNYTQSHTHLILYSERSDLAKWLSTCTFDNLTYIICLPSNHLKTPLFHLYTRRKELSEVNKLDTILLADYVTSLNRCVSDDCFLDYFTEKVNRQSVQISG